VITTIMTNHIALRIINWLISPGGPMRNQDGPLPQTPPIYESAYLPAIISGTRLHWGSVLALVMAVIVFFLLWRTILGSNHVVGISPTAAGMLELSKRRW
jgi:simple sugar transport system permease protein